MAHTGFLEQIHGDEYPWATDTGAPAEYVDYVLEQLGEAAPLWTLDDGTEVSAADVYYVVADAAVTGVRLELRSGASATYYLCTTWPECQEDAQGLADALGVSYTERGTA